MPEAVAQIKLGLYPEGDGAGAGDLVDAVAPLVFTLEMAVKLDPENPGRRSTSRRPSRVRAPFFCFLPRFPMLIPVACEIVARLARSLSRHRPHRFMVGIAGQPALDIYDLVAISRLVLTPLAVFDGVQLAKAAARSRGMAAATLRKLKMELKMEYCPPGQLARVHVEQRDHAAHFVSPFSAPKVWNI